MTMVINIVKMSQISLVALSFALCYFNIFVGAREGPVVSTENGLLQGISNTDSSGRNFDEFRGIPFAKPPVDDLRWEKPAPAESWEGTRDASEFSVHCHQIIAEGYPLIGLSSGNVSEDCLYLNVVVPGGVDLAADLPVMVYIFGGAFIIGTAEMYPMDQLALHGDVIAVGFNYRVGVMGFLSTGDENAVGNYGLWDCIAALQWVKNNIANFGGDPNKVTIFGESAGGVATTTLAISPAAAGLFQRAIAHSGGAISYHAWTDRNLDNAEALAELMDCPMAPTSEMVDCMRTKDAGDLDFWSYTATLVTNGWVPNWLPVIDGDLIPEDPRTHWQEGNINDFDFITGSTEDDAAAFILLNPLGLPLNDSYGFAATKEDLADLFDIMMLPYGEEIVDPAYAALRQQYPLMDSDDPEERTRSATDAMTDWVFGSASHWEGRAHSQRSTARNTYRYVYNYRQSYFKYPSWVNGSHLDDIHSVLGDVFLPVLVEEILEGSWSDLDMEVSRNTMSYWTNFAHTGNPNEGPNEVPTIWSQYDDTTKSVLRIGNRMMQDAESSQILEKYNYFNGPWRDIIRPPTTTKERKNYFPASNGGQPDINPYYFPIGRKNNKKSHSKSGKRVMKKWSQSMLDL